MMNASPKNQPVVGSARKNAKKGKLSPKGAAYRIARAARAEAMRVAKARKRAKNTPGSKGSKTTMFNTLNNNSIAMVAERLDDALPFASTSKRTRDLLADLAIKKKYNSIPGGDLSQKIHDMNPIERDMFLSKYMHLLPLVIQLEFGDHTRASNNYIDNVVIPAMMPRNVGGAETEDMLRLRSQATRFLFLHMLSKKSSDNSPERNSCRHNRQHPLIPFGCF